MNTTILGIAGTIILPGYLLYLASKTNGPWWLDTLVGLSAVLVFSTNLRAWLQVRRSRKLHEEFVARFRRDREEHRNGPSV